MQPGISTRVPHANDRLERQTASWPYLAGLGTVAFAYFLTAKLSLSSLNLGAEASPIWPPAGIALAAVIGCGRWAALGVALGAAWSHYTLGVSWVLSAGSVLGASLQAIVGANLLRQVGFRGSMERLHDVLGFVSLAVLISPLVNATIGTFVAFWVHHWNWDQSAQNWWTIWVGDGMGILIFTPSLLTFKQWVHYKSSGVSGFKERGNHSTRYLPEQWSTEASEKFSPRSTVERWLWLGSLIAVSWGVFYSQPNREIALYPLEYLPFPLVIWAALRFGQFRAALASSILSAIAISGTILGRGPFPAKAVDPSQMILLLQAFIGVITITAMILAAVMSTRQSAEQQLRLTAERNRLLSEMATRIRQSLDLPDILQTTVEEVRQFLQADRVFFTRFEPDGRCNVLAESVARGWTSTLEWESEPCDYQEIQAIFARDHIKIIHDTTKETVSSLIKQYHDRYQVKAGIAVPIMLYPGQGRWGSPESKAVPLPQDPTLQTVIHGLASPTPLSLPPLSPAVPQLLGILVVHQCSVPRQWQPLEVELLEQLGTQVAIAIQQGQLYQQVQALNANLEQQVTERTLQLQSSMTELEELNRLRDVFIHAIAHDLRTTVMGSLMVLKNLENQPGEEKVAIPRHFLERMIQSGEIQLCKLNSLLEAYKNKTEGIVIHPEPLALPALVQKILSDLVPMFELNQVQVVSQVPAELPCIPADREQIERVFRHFLVNAVKHNPPGVKVIVQAQLQGEELHCVVEDNGNGISSGQCDRLFDLSLGHAQERQLTGISLGLYLCQQIVTAHGGQIGVTSSVGKGSRFWFTLPVVEKEKG
jgi:signal transduction histidine kinase/integral membrane sensor domain MASE1